MLGIWLANAGVKLKGAVWLSVPLYYDLTKAIRRGNMMLYHRTEKEEEVVEKTAVSPEVGKLRELWGSESPAPCIGIRYG